MLDAGDEGACADCDVDSAIELAGSTTQVCYLLLCIPAGCVFSSSTDALGPLFTLEGTSA